MISKQRLKEAKRRQRHVRDSLSAMVFHVQVKWNQRRDSVSDQRQMNADIYNGGETIQSVLRTQWLQIRQTREDFDEVIKESTSANIPLFLFSIQ